MLLDQIKRILKNHNVKISAELQDELNTLYPQNNFSELDFTTIGTSVILDDSINDTPPKVKIINNI